MLRHSLISLTAALLVAQTPAPEAPKPAPAKVEATKPAAAKVEAPKPAPAKVEAVKKEDKEMARLGSRVLRESDFDLFLSLALNPQQRMQVEMVQGAKDQYRKQFLDFKVMEAKARKDGLDKGAEYQRKRELMEAQVLIQDLMKRDSPELQKKVVVDDANVKAYFEKHPDQFKSPASFNARHILVSVKGAPNAGATALPDEEAKAKAALAAKTLGEGKGWEAVAKEYSDDSTSKDKGGLYENITYGSFVPEFEEAVRKQEIGKVGEPVKTKFGYHLIQVEKRTESVLPAFETVKEKVHQKAQAAKQDEVFQAYVDGLKKEIGFTVGQAPVEAPKGKTPKKSGAKK